MRASTANFSNGENLNSLPEGFWSGNYLLSLINKYNHLFITAFMLSLFSSDYFYKSLKRKHIQYNHGSKSRHSKGGKERNGHQDPWPANKPRPYDPQKGTLCNPCKHSKNAWRRKRRIRGNYCRTSKIPPNDGRSGICELSQSRNLPSKRSRKCSLGSASKSRSGT